MNAKTLTILRDAVRLAYAGERMPVQTAVLNARATRDEFKAVSNAIDQMGGGGPWYFPSTLERTANAVERALAHQVSP